MIVRILRVPASKAWRSLRLGLQPTRAVAGRGFSGDFGLTFVRVGRRPGGPTDRQGSETGPVGRRRRARLPGPRAARHRSEPRRERTTCERWWQPRSFELLPSRERAEWAGRDRSRASQGPLRACGSFLHGLAVRCDSVSFATEVSLNLGGALVQREIQPRHVRAEQVHDVDPLARPRGLARVERRDPRDRRPVALAGRPLHDDVGEAADLLRLGERARGPRAARRPGATSRWSPCGGRSSSGAGRARTRPGCSWAARGSAWAAGEPYTKRSGKGIGADVLGRHRCWWGLGSISPRRRGRSCRG